MVECAGLPSYHPHYSYPLQLIVLPGEEIQRHPETLHVEATGLGGRDLSYPIPWDISIRSDKEGQSSVRDDIIREAEKTALKYLFPASCQGERILRIKSLTEEVEIAKDILAAVKPSILFPLCIKSKRRAPKFAREFPKAKFSSRQVSKRKASTYFARIAKRLRA